MGSHSQVRRAMRDLALRHYRRWVRLHQARWKDPGRPSGCVVNRDKADWTREGSVPWSMPQPAVREP